jgi:hypothetical protein
LAGNAGTFSIEQLADNVWSPLATGLSLRNNGWFSSDGKPATGFRHLNAGAGYLQARDVTGAGHYRDQFPFGQRLSTLGTGALSAAWQSRLARKWLIVNFRPDVLHFTDHDTLLTLRTLTGADQPGGLLMACWNNMFYTLDPSESDSRALMVTTFRDQDDLVVETRDGEEWLRLGSFLFHPAESLPSLTTGQAEEVAIGAEGLAEWRRISPTGQSATVELTTGGTWILLDASFARKQDGAGSAAIPVSGISYLMLQGEAGSRGTLAVGP